MHTRRLTVPGPIALRESVQASVARAVGRVPSRNGDVWWPLRTVDGPATLRLSRDGGHVVGEAWGDGADWVLERLPDLIGLDDDPSAFDPLPGVVRDLHRRRPGLRLGRTRLIFQTLIPVILGQRVTSDAARASYRALVRSLGEPAPGPIDAWVPPPAEKLASLDYADLHPLGVERSRAVILVEAARRAHRLEQIVCQSRDDAYRVLTALRGIGPWSAGIVMGAAWGDPDAVPLGDYHLPHTVAGVLAGEPRGDDTRMVELLEPFRGHRRRVVHLLQTSGIHAPRYGPRTAVREIRYS